MKVKCPCCNNWVEVETYYSRHRTELLNKYKENMKDPEFVEYRRKIALKAYNKKKNDKKNYNS